MKVQVNVKIEHTGLSSFVIDYFLEQQIGFQQKSSAVLFLWHMQWGRIFGALDHMHYVLCISCPLYHCVTFMIFSHAVQHIESGSSSSSSLTSCCSIERVQPRRSAQRMRGATSNTAIDLRAGAAFYNDTHRFYVLRPQVVTACS